MDGNGCRDPKTSIRRLGETCREWGDGLKELEGSRTHKNLELTNLGPWVFLETKLPTKEYVWAGRRPPPIYVADVQLGLYVGLLTIGVGAVSAAACLWIPFLLLYCLAWPQWERMR